MDTYRNFIAGQWVQSSSSRTVENINPANTDDVIGSVRQATREEAKQAVQAAAEHSRCAPLPLQPEQDCGSRCAFDGRAQRRIGSNPNARKGKTIAESRGELQRSINVADFCAGESRRMNGETIQSETAGEFAYTIKQPLGVVACVTPWNFPVAIPVWKVAPALVAGNTVVFKPATLTPATGVRIVELLKKPASRQAY